jgi:hypothetical protein
VLRVGKGFREDTVLFTDPQHVKGSCKLRGCDVVLDSNRQHDEQAETTETTTSNVAPED